MPKRAAKARPSSAIPIPTALNISALARDAGVSRKTITRRLAKGWRPDMSAPLHTPPVPARTPLSVPAPVAVRVMPVRHGDVRARTPLRPPLGVVRGVLLLLAVGFYVFVACAAIGR